MRLFHQEDRASLDQSGAYDEVPPVHCQMVGRELVGVVGIIEKGFADAVGIEYERLKGLLNKHL
jgi:hypothetical protein